MAAAKVLIILPPSENPNQQYDRGLKARFPQLDVAWVHHHTQVGPHIADAEVILTFSPFIAPHVVQKARRLKWIQVLGSGVDGVVDLPLAPEVLITSAHGYQATPVSEATIGLMLALARGFWRMARNQDRAVWERWPSQLLDGKTLGVVGVGAIAEVLARKCQALGMKTVGITQTPRAAPYFDQMRSRSDLAGAVADIDFLVLLTPHTPQTHHLIDAQVLAAMKPEAFLVNVARGGVVDEAALVQALRERRIQGAALDVFEDHPLGQDSPLWAMDNVIVSPHLAGLNDVYGGQIMPLLESNFRSFLAGDLGAMINVIQRR
jgi:D-2-hydroxyacid dehydrogenase (NADP+)